MLLSRLLAGARRRRSRCLPGSSERAGIRAAAALLLLAAALTFALPGRAALLWQVCEHPQTCFASAQERQAWGRAHSCQFLEDVCEKAPASSDWVGAPDEDASFWGDLWSAVKNSLTYGYQFVKGLMAGLRDQVAGLLQLVTGFDDVVSGLVHLGKSFYDDPRATLEQLAEILGQDAVDTLTRATQCGPYDLGKVVGQNLSPIPVAKLATRLARYSGDLRQAVRAVKVELGCASFAADTPVLTPDGAVPIQQITVGSTVLSRSDRGFADAPQAVTRTFTRSVDHHRRLVTESGAFSLTDEHPLWLQGSGWRPAKELRQGDAIATIDGDTLVLHNEAVQRPLTVYNFSVAHTPSYFVGRGVWAHNTLCELPAKLYRAPRALLTYRLGASDGGPGIWTDRDRLKKLNRPDTPDYRYQSEVTGAPRNVEYQVGGVNFDGYDPATKTLLEIKRYEPGNPLTKVELHEKDFVASMKREILEQAREQLDAAKGVRIEWHVSGREEAKALKKLFESPIDGENSVNIEVVWTPRITS